MIGLMFLIFAVCMILAIPVGFSIAISATAFLFFDAGIPIFSIVQKMIDGINSFPTWPCPCSFFPVPSWYTVQPPA